MSMDQRFTVESGREVFNGNELLMKGALEVEGGVHLLTGYPGSPIAGFFDCMGDISDLLQQKGIRAFQANNEALSVAAVNGSQMAPCRAIAAFKSVGTHVASDALALGTLAGAHTEGGAVIIMGEDPWCDSTQVPADSRFLCEHLRMAVVEPGTPQELKDWVDLSFKLSRAAGLYIGYIVTVAHADGGGTVQCKPNHWPSFNTNQRMALETKDIPVDRTVLLPPRTWQRELLTDERYATTIKAARELGMNRIEAGNCQPPGGGCPLGFIVTGMAGPYLRHVLHDLGLEGQFPILDMGMSYPVDIELVREFSRLCDKMIVVEERRSFLEKNIRDAAARQLPSAEGAELSARLFGKAFPSGPDGKVLKGIPDTRGLNYSVLAQHLIPLIQSTEQIPPQLRNGRLSDELKQLRAASKPRLDVVAEVIVPRTPTFCPGCPHRDSSATLLELRRNLLDPKYMMKHHGIGPVDLVAHGDTGCYTMLMFAPTESLMHNYSGMGLGGGTGSGIDPFITNKQIVFMGDGTFFHSGQVAISNAIKASQDITFIILENKTTAMTGHQEHAGTELDVLGNRSYIQDIEEIARGMAGTSPMTVVKLRPDDRSTYYSVLEKAILSDGVKVVIADKECGITYHRKEFKKERQIIKEKGYLPKKTHMNVTLEVCENCLECTKQTACPGLTSVPTDYGSKIDTDLTWCVNDGACERVRVSNDYGTHVKPCPSFEQVTVYRKKRKRYSLPRMNLDKLTEPAWVRPMDQAGQTWRAHMSGVGGMGIGVVGAILIRAGHNEGYRTLFQDKKGLAIRNGGVFAQITFIKDDPSTQPAPNRRFTTASIPYGRADLLLGIDILEAARAIDAREQFRVASRGHTAAVLNMHKQATVNTLLGRQDFSPEQLRDEVMEHCNPEWSYSKNLAELCEKRLGSKQYANIMMLGTAFQLGLIPVSAHSIAWAIKDTIRRDHRKNLKAFNIGRKLALEPRAIPNMPQPETWEQLLTNKVRILRKTRLRGRLWAGRFEKLVQWAIKQMPDLPEKAKYDLTLRLYDTMQYQDHRLARRYGQQVLAIYRQDTAQRQFAATNSAIWNLAKVVMIKDEPYVSYLLTRYEKKQRDVAKYGVDLANGDRLAYRHYTNPEFNIGKLRIRLKLTTRDWQLQLVRRCKFVRQLPGWHRREKAFRDWYLTLLAQVKLDTDNAYEKALRLINCPADVTGYREIRYPKQDDVRRRMEAELSPASPPRSAAVAVLDVLRQPGKAT